MTVPSERESPRLRVLLVDDRPDIRLVVKTLLTLTPQVEIVAEAGDGREAIDLAAAHQPDLIVLDLMMPVMTGLEALPLLRLAAPRCRVVVLSSLSEQAPHALAAGAAVYVEKGSPPARLARDILIGAGLLDTVITALRPPKVSRHFPSQTSSPQRARAFARDALREWSQERTRDTVELLITELVTNAVVHAHSEPRVSLRLLPDRIHVEVADDDSSDLAIGGRGLEEESGRGLALVNALALAWGSTTTEPGKVIWFDVARDEDTA